MLFSADESITADMFAEPETVRRFLQAASDAELINDYLFLKSLSDGFRSCDSFILDDEYKSCHGCYLEQFLDVFERYLFFLYDEIASRFISRYRSEHVVAEEKSNESEVSYVF